MKRWHILLYVLTLIVAPQQLSGQRAIPDDNLGYPVLITLSECSNNITLIKGSGFYLDAGTEEYLITARHVLFNESELVQPNQARSLLCKKAELVSYSKDPKDRQQNRIVLDLQELNRTGKVKAHPTKDVAAVQIAVNHPNTMDLVPGATALTIAPSGVLSAALSNVKKFDDVLTANDVYVFGYPSSIGIPQAPQIDYDTPLLRKGIIAGVNASKKTIVLDCLTFFGNSGGPVLQAVHVGLGMRFDVIGVISQYVPFTETWVNTTLSYSNMQVYNSGYSIAEPMDSVLELIGK